MNTFKRKRWLKGASGVIVTHVPGIASETLGYYEIRYKNMVCFSHIILKDSNPRKQLDNIYEVQCRLRRFIRSNYPTEIGQPMLRSFNSFSGSKAQRDIILKLNEQAQQGRGTSLQFIP